jgi:hypothetical protein
VVADAGEEIGGGEGWGVIGLGDVGDLPVAGAPDGLVFFEEDDVAVAAGGGVAGPFVAGEDDEFVVAVEGADGVVEALPVVVGDLEIVALVGAEVEEGDVAGESKIFFFGAGADGCAGLGVEVAPVLVEWAGALWDGLERAVRLSLGLVAMKTSPSRVVETSSGKAVGLPQMSSHLK